VQIREKLAFGSAQVLRSLRKLKDRFPRAEFMLLCTCNRVELYCIARVPDGPKAADLADFLAKWGGISSGRLQRFIYVHLDEKAVHHLLTVSCGLDSMVLGEEQIIGQVKDSYRLACNANATGRVLNRLFHRAFAAAKKVRSATSISSGRVSVAGVAVEMAKQLFEKIASAKVLVIGAGEMGQLLVRHLLHCGCQDITIINRSFARAKAKASQFGVDARKWQELAGVLAGADIAIACAASRRYLFSKQSLRRIMKGRAKAPLLIIDIAVPRNFGPGVNEIKNVWVYSIDDLREVAQRNLQARQQELSRARHIIRQQAAEFMNWFTVRDIGPLVGQMRERFAEAVQKELSRFFAGPRRDAAHRQELELGVNRIVNRLLHCVIKNVNTMAKQQGPAEAARLINDIIRDVGVLSAPVQKKEKMRS
jgi:glutamyl-tRNA reductase